MISFYQSIKAAQGVFPTHFPINTKKYFQNVAVSLVALLQPSGSRYGGNWRGSIPITGILCCRDVKPSNFLYDRVGRRYALVDFGLAQYQKDLCAAAAAGQQQATGRGSKRKAEEDHESETASYSKKGESLRQCSGARSVGTVSFLASRIRSYSYGSGYGYVI